MELRTDGIPLILRQYHDQPAADARNLNRSAGRCGAACGRRIAGSCRGDSAHPCPRLNILSTNQPPTAREWFAAPWRPRHRNAAALRLSTEDWDR